MNSDEHASQKLPGIDVLRLLGADPRADRPAPPEPSWITELREKSAAHQTQLDAEVAAHRSAIDEEVRAVQAQGPSADEREKTIRAVHGHVRDLAERTDDIASVLMAHHARKHTIEVPRAEQGAVVSFVRELETLHANLGNLPPVLSGYPEPGAKP
ncbi:hypothetical protein H9P43_003976 [Blastocladiella emersonii ATCC 22665]|nr:hypothetical protein H9P43_003976 [Blastocladiella emersonii ATCC 22665]